MFTPTEAFELDEITTVYYDADMTAVYIRNDTDYSVDGVLPAWYAECKKLSNPKKADKHDKFYSDNKAKIRKAAQNVLVAG